MRGNAKLAFHLIVFLVGASVCSAQDLDANVDIIELRPLVEIFVTGEQQEDYYLVRCAGLIFATISWTGEDNHDDEVLERSKLYVLNLTQAAIDFRYENFGHEDDGIVYRDVSRISNLYRQKFDQNFAVSGKGIFSDEKVLTDIRLCYAFYGGI